MSEHEPLRPLSASQRQMLETATSRYQAAVTADVARYLLARGIDRETARTFRLGVVADPVPGHGRYAGFLAIPYLDAKGRPLSLRFRCMQNHTHRDFGHGKYMSISREPGRMFNVGAIHRADDTIHLCEGELDAIILTLIGLLAVAVPGAESWQPHFRRMLAGFSTVWVWADPDEAGADLTARVTRALRAAKPAELSIGDVGETYLHGGPAALHALIGAGATQ